MNSTTESSRAACGSRAAGECSAERRHHTLIACLVAAACFGLTAMAQGHAPVSAVPVPGALKSKVSALGDRFVKGNERLVLSGSITRPGAAATPVSLVYQMPGKIRYQEGTTTLVFDGTQAKGSQSLSTADQDLLESLLDDSMEGLVYSVPRAMLFRPLMYRARLDDGKSKGYSGPYVDIYEIILPVASQRATVRRQKHFYFDSTTELLARVVYLSGADGSVRVETHFQNWQMVTK